VFSPLRTNDAISVARDDVSYVTTETALVVFANNNL